MSVNERVLRCILSGNFHSRNTTYWLPKVTHAGVLSYEERSVELGTTYLSITISMNQNSISANAVLYSYQSPLKRSYQKVYQT
jgi:hypothetical protein